MISKFLVLCLVVLIYPFSAQAETWFGINMGPNFSSYTNATGLTEQAQFAVSGFIDLHLQDMWYVEGALRYNAYAEGTSSGSASYDNRFRYLEVPILIKPMIDAGGWYPYALLGPAFGFRTGQEAYSTGDITGFPITTFTSKTFNMMLDFGAGAEFAVLSNVRVMMQLEYVLGLTNIVNDSSGLDSKTRGLLLTFGALTTF